MNQKAFANWLKAILVGVGIGGVLLYFVVLPIIGTNLAVSWSFDSRISDDPWQMFLESCYWVWLIFLWCSGVPCFTVLGYCWKIATRIGRDQSFSVENAKAFRVISWLAAGDAAFFFVGNIVLLLVNYSHPGIFLCAMLVVFVGVAVAIGAACLSHLVQKAAELQDEHELTI